MVRSHLLPLSFGVQRNSTLETQLDTLIKIPAGQSRELGVYRPVLPLLHLETLPVFTQQLRMPPWTVTLGSGAAIYPRRRRKARQGRLWPAHQGLSSFVGRGTAAHAVQKVEALTNMLGEGFEDPKVALSLKTHSSNLNP